MTLFFRRDFITTSATALALSAGRAVVPNKAATAQDAAPNSTSASHPPKIYPRGKIPRVDIHAHIAPAQLTSTDQFVAAMDAGRIAVSVILSGSQESAEQLNELRQRYEGRLLMCPRDSNPEDGLWWSSAELDDFRQRGYAGTKIWCQYRQGLLVPEIIAKIQHQGEIGLPVIGLHISDPPEGKFWKPNYWECIYEAEKLIQLCPNTTFIMAHGFWLMNQDRGLELLGDYFDRHSNLHVDLCAVFQWWDQPEPSFDKLRNFIIRYKDRLLFGTDGNPSYTTAERLSYAFSVLESSESDLRGFFSGDATQATVRGLDLPTDVLNYIYYWNAARTVPEVRKALLELGYEV